MLETQCDMSLERDCNGLKFYDSMTLFVEQQTDQFIADEMRARMRPELFSFRFVVEWVSEALPSADGILYARSTWSRWI